MGTRLPCVTLFMNVPLLDGCSWSSGRLCRSSPPARKTSCRGRSSVSRSRIFAREHSHMSFPVEHSHPVPVDSLRCSWNYWGKVTESISLVIKLQRERESWEKLLYKIAIGTRLCEEQRHKKSLIFFLNTILQTIQIKIMLAFGPINNLCFSWTSIKYTKLLKVYTRLPLFKSRQ